MVEPKISVIIPVYNPGKYFLKCIDSIVNQTHRNLEIILIDDGSTDGSAEICDEYAKKDDRIIVRHQKNGGVSKARNAGLELATGDYINFPDSDDYIDLDTYEYVLKQIEENQTDAACFEYFTTYPQREIKHTASDELYGVCDTKASIEELLFSNRSFLCTKVLPKKAVENLRFYEDIYRDEDTIFCMLALHNTQKTVFLERPMYHYVQSEESACRGVFRPNQLSAIKAIPIMEEFLGKNYPDLMNRWRGNYMNLMIMLYCDMYFDEKDYPEEQKQVYQTFKALKAKTKGQLSLGRKTKAKFSLFSISPKLFCLVHKRIH